MNPINKIATGVYKGVNSAGRALKSVISGRSKALPQRKDALAPVLQKRDNIAGSPINPASGYMKHLQEIDSY